METITRIADEVSWPGNITALPLHSWCGGGSIPSTRLFSQVREHYGCHIPLWFCRAGRVGCRWPDLHREHVADPASAYQNAAARHHQKELSKASRGSGAVKRAIGPSTGAGIADRSGARGSLRRSNISWSGWLRRMPHGVIDGFRVPWPSWGIPSTRSPSGISWAVTSRHHIEPAPQRRTSGIRWTPFLQTHGEVLAATDCFAVEVATWYGLVTYDVLVVMELATRRVQMAGMTPHPTMAFMQPCARQLTDPVDGFLLGKRSLLHDRDTKFTHMFDALLKDSGVEPIVLPPRSPHLNAHGERFVRSIKAEALDHIRILGERSLSYVVRQYLVHDHAERNHQGLDN